uniref:Genome polyprotein n=1 Tax=Rangifer tarandus hepacivirus TaxID=3051135 RepID=A0AAT9US66_9FLAV
MPNVSTQSRSRSRSRSRRRRSRPRVAVVVPTSTDGGPRRRRNRGRDYRWPYVDAGLGWTVEVLTPVGSPSGDPYKRSQNLGRLIDGPLSWAADLGRKVPLIGSPLGWCCRLVGRVVRLGEDLINAATRSTVGFSIFILALLSCLVPCAGYRYVQDGDHYLLTNCCNDSDILYATGELAYHLPGCVVCELRDNATECWDPVTTFISQPKNASGVDHELRKHIEILVTLAGVCDLFDVGDRCGVAVTMLMGITRWLPRSIRLNTTGDCYLEVPYSPLSPVIGFFNWLVNEGGLFAWTTSLIARIPFALYHLVRVSSTGFLLVLVWFGLSGQWARLVLVGVLVVEVSTEPCNLTSIRQASHDAAAYGHITSCSPLKQPCECTRVTHNVTEMWCFGDSVVEVKPHADSLNGSYVSVATLPRLPGIRGCVFRGTDYNTTCCRVKTVPAWCKGCSSDCSWLNPKYTYEACGTTPCLTTQNDNGSAYCVAWIVKAATYSGFAITFDNRNWINVQYRQPRSADPRKWARLAGGRRLYGGMWAFSPNGTFAPISDLATGLISKSRDDPNKQIVYSGGGAITVPHLSWTLFLALVAGLFKSRTAFIGLVFASLWTQATAQLLAPWVTAVAIASTWDEWWMRVIVYLLLCRSRRPYRFVLCNKMYLTLFLLLMNVLGVAAFMDEIAFTPTVALLAVTLVSLFGSGLFAAHAPTTSFVCHYLLEWLSCFSYHLENTNGVQLLLVILGPAAMLDISMGLLAMTCTVWIIGVLVPRFMLPRRRSVYERLIDGAVALPCAKYLQRLILFIAGEAGVVWYRHLGQQLNLLPGVDVLNGDPYSAIRSRLEYIEDAGRKFCCGDLVRGRPVIGRHGSRVAIGWAALPLGFEPCSPIGVRKVASRGELKTWAVSLTGVDTALWEGTIFTLGTMSRRYMGFSCGGLLHTVCHGAGHRSLASTNGPLPPVVFDDAADYAMHVAPRGAKDLDICTCSPSNGFMVTRIGTVIPLRMSAQNLWAVQSPLPLSICKGCSGGPVLCSAGHVIAMVQRCRAVSGSVAYVCTAPVRATAGGDRKSVRTDLSAPPAVGTSWEVQTVYAPTGSGKTTLLPMHYVRKGYQVLVLNPSVATTMSMPEYMKKQFGINPNLRAAEMTLNTGARLTYSTYGRWLADGKRSIQADVIICDECHAVDSTTILGIGSVLATTPESKCKLVLLATATPPGQPVLPHPNIQEIELDDTGDISFHGKKLKLATYKTGRHLIFQNSKKHCEALAADLRSRGLKAVAYYRGLPLSTIPIEGDCVVVATDALMTGYTGNFDSVTDCNLATIEDVEVDFDPTITVSLKVVPANSVTRAQRRGRTGRGSPGVYYYVTSDTPLSGTAPEAAVFGAFDAGMAWFGFSPAEVLEALDSYRVTPGLPILRGALNEISAFFAGLGWVTPAFVNKARIHATSFVWLNAAQRQICYENGCNPPDPQSPIWKGVRVTGEPCRILCHLEGHQPLQGPTPEIVTQLQLAFTELEVWGAVTAATAASVFALGLALDYFGSVSITSAFVLDPGEPTHAPAPQDLDDGFEECWGVPEFIEPVVTTCRVWVARVQLWAQGVAQSGAIDDVNNWFAANLITIASALQLGAGVLISPDNPLLAGLLSFSGAVSLPISRSAQALVITLGAILTARLTTAEGAVFIAGATLAGFQLAGSPVLSILLSTLSTYVSFVPAFSVVFKLLDGQLPSTVELASLINCAFAPGAAVAAVAVAVGAIALTQGTGVVWMNRLLSMVAKSNVISPDYFVEARNLRATIKALFDKLHPWNVVKTAIKFLTTPTDVPCGWNIWDHFYSVWHVLCKWAKALYEAVVGIAKRAVAIPGVPIASCQPGYAGPWKGEGMVTTRCECGRDLVFAVDFGQARIISGSRLCRNYWAGTVPINNTTSGPCRPHPSAWNTLTVQVGFGFVTYRLDGETVSVIATSSPDVTVPRVIPRAAAAAAVNGRRTDPYSGDPATPWRGTVWRDTGNGREKISLPFVLVEYRTDETIARAFEMGDNLPRSQMHSEPTDEGVGAVRIEAAARVESVSRLMEGPVDDFPLDTPEAAELRQELDRAELMRSDAGTDGHWTGLTPQIGQLQYFDTPPPKREKPKQVVTFVSLREVGASQELMAPSDDHPVLAPSASVLPSLDVTTQPRPPRSVSSQSSMPSLEASATREAPRGPGSVASSGAGGAPAMSEHSCKTAWSDAKLSVGSSRLGDSSEADCSYSYIWDGIPYVAHMAERSFSAVAAMTHGLVQRNLVYVTEPKNIMERIRKVTRFRPPAEPNGHLDMLTKQATKLVSNLNLQPMTYSEAAAATSNTTARSAVTGYTGRDVKSGRARDAVLQVYDDLIRGPLERPANEVTIMPKAEVFMRNKPTDKPPRIIAYPHLETRVAEKMVLGHIGPGTVKKVLGKAYGFVPPKERINRLLAMWRRPSPMAFSCDVVTFDSQITPDDVAREASIYCSATKDSATRARIYNLHKFYASGPMVDQRGNYVGTRNCRASGVFTTSSSNTMTAFLKVKAACMTAGFEKPEFLVAGDDVVITTRASPSPEQDRRKLGVFASAMKAMGAPVELPRPKYSLEDVTSCSSNVTAGFTRDGKLIHFLTRDPSIPFARCSAEGDRFNPVGAWVGNLLWHFPCLWVRIISVHLLEQYLESDFPETVSVDWYGRQVSLKIQDLPYILTSMHGNDGFDVSRYTPYEMNRVAAALKACGMKPLRWWRKRARTIRSACFRKGGMHKFLAYHLLSFAVNTKRVPLDPKAVARFSVELGDVYTEEPIQMGNSPGPPWFLASLLVGLIVLLITLFH